MSEKIRANHLDRTAYVYVRQSSLHQVRHHQEGKKRQYSLADRAEQLGFPKVIVIDDDQGRSGTGSEERPGFARLLAAVCQGDAGAVLALEASRLARNNRDWHHLIDFCGLTETLIIDDDGVYDPRQLNDRLLLGLKGSMAEFELGLFRQRAREAFLQMVRRGLVLWEVPVGYVRTEDYHIEMIPDRQVEEAISGVFQKFRELGSARQTLLWYREEQIPLPHAILGTAGREIRWALPEGGRILQILRNPYYAGAFAYGRTGSKTVVEDAAKKSRRHRKPHEEWTILILDHHPGYITWEEYLRNQQVLEANLAGQRGETTGAAKGGAALLSGLLRCGRCGRKLSVRYSGRAGGAPSYRCHGGRVHRGSAGCFSVGSWGLERAVIDVVLEAIQPVGIEAAMAAVEQASQEGDGRRKAIELALEKAQYEVHRAKRQYDAVDPDNRLVAGELETRWNEALTSVAELESRLAALGDRPPPLNEAQKEHLFDLAGDLPILWNHPAAPAELKKRILRTVLEDIVIDSTDDQHILQIHWQGGVHTELRVRRNRPGQHHRAADGKVLDLVVELSKVCNDRTIAAVLNRLGYCTGQGKTWRAHRVANLRYHHRLPRYKKSKDWLTLEQTAEALEVSNTVIKRLIKQGVLPGRQVVSYAPWIVERDALALPGVQAAVQAVRQGRKLPRTVPGQQELPLK